MKEGTFLHRSFQLVLLLLGITSALSGCGTSQGNQADHRENRTTLVLAATKEPKVPLPKGAPPKHLVVKDLRQGHGQEAQAGDELVTRLVAKFVTGEQLESSWNKPRLPFVFKLGAKEANPGWENGMPGMKVGGKRELIVPPDEGSRFGVVGDGKPDATLVYVVELEAIIPPELKERKEPKLIPPKSPPPQNLEVRTLIKGTGPTDKIGDLLTVEYVGIRYDGKHFTNSWKRSKPFQFQLGAESIEVSPGFEKGVEGMRVGERREVVIPPKWQYRGGSAPATSNPSDALVYVIDLMGITEDAGHQPQ